MTENRRDASRAARISAANAAHDRAHPDHLANGDEQRWAGSRYAMSFTKGLKHCPATGLLNEREDFEAFRHAVDLGEIDRFTVGFPNVPQFPTSGRRKWEAPTTGVVYDLQGPDAQAVTMAPAPALGEEELAYEMAEVYELAVLRDVPLNAFSVFGPANAAQRAQVQDSADRLNLLPYDPATSGGRARKTDASGALDLQTAFRGSSPDVEIGPYLSQFMLIGNDDITGDETNGIKPDDGRIRYGALTIDQRVPAARCEDWMTTKGEWLCVQDGECVRNDKTLFILPPHRRFISTPRDLATYVHDDALYEAYLNAALILLAQGTPFDRSFHRLSAQEPPGGGNDLNAGGFALFGGPHILTLITEVATRALKAVRHQKFNTHIRLRPEALAGRIACVQEIENHGGFPELSARLREFEASIQPTINAVKSHPLNKGGDAFLPMAFQEGSPMHPAYGAGHATVAGACVTVLKAWFDTSAVLLSGKRKVKGKSKGVFGFLPLLPGDKPVARVASAGTACGDDKSPPDIGARLVDVAGEMEAAAGRPVFLTLEGELNKLAANISIGRNMAGVHYFSDYYDSLRMGEEIAIAMLEEQALCYPTDPFVLSLTTFDGDVVRIGAR